MAQVTPLQEGPGYLPWVDGLRAVAVSLVIAFHAGFLPGGYLGVDVFFVISGYVVTNSLLHRGIAGWRGALAFYVRRAKRLFPALIVVCSTTAVLAPWLLLPEDFKSFGITLIGALTWVANVVLYLDDGYFATAVRDNPLMHSWSLGVEAQVYVLMPLIAGFGVLTRRWTLAVWAGLAAISLALWLGLGAADPQARFLLMPFRLWELALGAMLALALAQGSQRLQMHGWFGLLGLAVIVLLALATVHDVEDRIWAVPLAAAATALLLVAGHAGRAIWTRCLELRPVLFIGVISYSLYLWHQVLFAFGRAYLGQEPSVTGYIALTGVAVLLAWVTWIWVENPVRAWQSPWTTPWTTPQRIGAGVAVIATLACGVAGVVAFVTDGAPGRLGKDSAALYDVYEARWAGTRSVGCRRAAADCPALVPGSGDRINVVLMGDSHARVLQEPLRDLLERDAALSMRTHIRTRTCRALLEQSARNWDMIIKEPGIDVVIVACRLDQLLGFDADVPMPMWHAVSPSFQSMPVMDIARRVAKRRAKSWDANTQALHDVLSQLAASGKSVILVNQAPLLPGSAIRRGIGTLVDGDTLQTLDLPRDRVEMRHAPADEALDVFIRTEGITLFSTRDVLCDAEACPVIADGVPLYFDEDHLSVAGAERVVPALADATRNLLDAAERR